MRRAHQIRSYGSFVQYEIRFRGHLGPRWAAWFDGLRLTANDDGTTALRGPVVDQAALHGLLQKLRDLGITLLSLTSSAPPPAIFQPQNPCTHTNHRPTGASS